MNNVELTGRLTRDVELKRTPDGKSVVSFSLAVDKKNKERDADFIPCVAWSGTAEAMSRYLKKGSKIALTGRLSTRSYEKNGEKRFVMEVVAGEVEFLDSKSATNDFVPANIKDEDLPF